MDIETHLTKIAYQLHQAETHLALIRASIAGLEQSGIYPALPTERWKDDRYLYLYFPNGAPGLHLDAKQRLYIGADPTRIAEARRLVNNTRQYENLLHSSERLRSWLASTEHYISELAGRAGQWPRAEAGLLGLDLAGQPGAPSPNGLGSDIRAGREQPQTISHWSNENPDRWREDTLYGNCSDCGFALARGDDDELYCPDCGKIGATSVAIRF